MKEIVPHFIGIEKEKSGIVDNRAILIDER